MYISLGNSLTPYTDLNLQGFCRWKLVEWVVKEKKKAIQSKQPNDAY